MYFSSTENGITLLFNYLMWSYKTCPKSAERLIDRRALGGEQARALFGEVETVFQSDAEFTVDGDHRLVAETHSRPQQSLVSPNEIRPLMAVEADAVSGAVRQPRNLVVGAKAGVGYHFARSRVHRFASRAGRSARTQGALKPGAQIGNTCASRFPMSFGTRPLTLYQFSNI